MMCHLGIVTKPIVEYAQNEKFIDGIQRWATASSYWGFRYYFASEEIFSKDIFYI